MTRKTFGGRERPKTEEFDLVTTRDDGTRHTHTFALVPAIPAGDLISIMRALKTAPEDSGPGVARLMHKILVNSDGVSASWNPTPLPKRADHPDDVPSYRGPDGEIHPFSDEETLAKFTAFDAGSSRRRWDSLMDPDNDVDAIEMADLVEIMEWVASLATERPTSPRA